MTDTIKVTQMTLQTPSKNDYLMGVNSYPMSVRYTAESLQNILAEPWKRFESTAFYSSATQIRVSGNYAKYFITGTKLKVVQNSVTKYFYVLSSQYTAGNTYINIFGGTSYTLEDSAITSLKLSYDAAEFSYLDYTPTWSATGGISLGNGTVVGRAAITNNTCTVLIRFTIGSTTNVGTSTNWKFSLPIPASSNTIHTLGNAIARDVSANTFYSYTPFIYNGNTEIQYFVRNSTDTNYGISYNVPFTWAATDQLLITLTYEI